MFLCLRSYSYIINLVQVHRVMLVITAACAQERKKVMLTYRLTPHPSLSCWEVICCHQFICECTFLLYLYFNKTSSWDLSLSVYENSLFYMDLFSHDLWCFDGITTKQSHRYVFLCFILMISSNRKLLALLVSVAA